MHDKMAISPDIFEKSRKDPFLRPQIRATGYFQLMGFSRFYLKYTCTKI